MPKLVTDPLNILAGRILSLHEKVSSAGFTYCDHCFTGDPYCTVGGPWPCPTAEIVLRTLGQEE